MTTDIFAAYRPKQSDPKQEEEDIFSAYRPESQNEESESLGSKIGRNLGRSGARVAETVLGAPREFGEFLEGLVPEKTLIKGAEKIGLGEGAKTLLQTTKKIAPYKIFPKSEQIKDFLGDIFGEKLEPKNEWEKKADETISDFAALAIPFPGSKLKFLKPALLSLGGNIASHTIGKMGGTDKEKAYGKLGTMFLGSLVNPGGLKKLTSELFQKAKENRAPNSTVPANNIMKDVKNFRNYLNKGGSAGSKTQSLKKLDEIEKSVKNGHIEIEELEKFKQSLNEARANLYEEFKSNKPGRKLAKANLDKVSKIVDDGLKEYGKINPQWETYYRSANEAFGTIAQSNKAKNFISRNLGKISPHLTAGLFGLGKSGGVQALSSAATGLGATAAIVEGGALLSRIMNSPILRRYYLGVLENAVKENAVVMRENLKKLEESLSKEDQS